MIRAASKHVRQPLAYFETLVELLGTDFARSTLNYFYQAIGWHRVVEYTWHERSSALVLISDSVRATQSTVS